MDMGQEEQQDVSDPDSVIYTDYVATSADANPDSKMEGSNETNEMVSYVHLG